MECRTHESMETCGITLRYLPPGTEVDTGDLAECSDCHLVIAIPNDSMTRLIIYCSGCRGMLREFERIVGSDKWHEVDIDTLCMLPPSFSEYRQAGVVRFILPYIMTEDDLLGCLAGSGRPVDRYEDVVR